MRRLFIATLLVFVTAGLYGQNGGHKVEVGAGLAPFYVSTVESGIQAPLTYAAYAEWRNDFGHHLDVGAKLDYKISPATVKDFTSGSSFGGTQHYGTLLALADYNFRPAKTFNPFIGVGIGPALQIDNAARNTVSPGKYNPKVLFVASPRIGIELSRHLRISTSIDLSLNDTKYPICFNVGWTF